MASEMASHSVFLGVSLIYWWYTLLNFVFLLLICHVHSIIRKVEDNFSFRKSFLLIFSFPNWVQNAFSFHQKCLAWVVPPELWLPEYVHPAHHRFYKALTEHAPAHLLAHCLWTLLH